MEPQMTGANKIVEYDGELIEFPGITRGIVWPDIDHGGEFAVRLVCEALEVFAPLVRPLSADVLLRAYRDAEMQYPVDLLHPHWFAASRDTGSNPLITPSTGGSIARHVDAITPASLRGLIDEAIVAEALGPEIFWTCDEVR